MHKKPSAYQVFEYLKDLLYLLSYNHCGKRKNKKDELLESQCFVCNLYTSCTTRGTPFKKSSK